MAVSKLPSPTKVAEEKHQRNTEFARKVVFEANHGHKYRHNWPVIAKKDCPPLDKTFSKWLERGQSSV